MTAFISNRNLPIVPTAAFVDYVHDNCSSCDIFELFSIDNPEIVKLAKDFGVANAFENSQYIREVELPDHVHMFRYNMNGHELTIPTVYLSYSELKEGLSTEKLNLCVKYGNISVMPF
jgi:hypothetical protein